MKKCSKCKQLKPFEMFLRRLDRPNGWQSQCRECVRILSAKWKEKNRERVLTYYRNFHALPERQRYLREHYRRNKRHKQQYASAWKKENADKVVEYAMRHTRAKRRATPPWLTTKQQDEMKEMYLLASELSWLSEGGLCVDHIVPLQSEIVSGLHVPWNLRIISISENSSKGNRLIHDT